jgi:hypothetical protein
MLGKLDAHEELTVLHNFFLKPELLGVTRDKGPIMSC